MKFFAVLVAALCAIPCLAVVPDTTYVVTTGVGRPGTFNVNFYLDGAQSPSITVERGKIYQFNVQSSSTHPFYIGSASAGCNFGGSAFRTAGEICYCPPNNGVFRGDGSDGLILFTPGASTPNTLYYGCAVHCNMGGLINVTGSASGVGLTANDCPCTRSSLSSRVKREVAEAHGAFMFLAFGALFPFGGFLAHIGRVKLHMLNQLVAIVFALVGFILIYVYIDNGEHFKHSHAYLGTALLIMSFFLQPIFVRMRMRVLHRRNGQAIAMFGLANVFLGLVLLDQVRDVPQGLQLAYAFWVFLLLAVYILYNPPAKFHRGGPASLSSITAGPSKVKPGLGLAPPALSTRNLEDAQPNRAVELTNLVTSMSPSSAGQASATGMDVVTQLRYESLLALSTEAIVVADGTGCITTFSSGAESLFGHSAKDVAGLPLSMLMPERYRIHHDRAFKARSEEPEEQGIISTYNRIYSVYGLTKEGYEFPVEISISSFSVNQQRVFTAVIVDLREKDGGQNPANERKMLEVPAPVAALTEEKKEDLERQAAALTNIVGAPSLDANDVKALIHANFEKNKFQFSDDEEAMMAKAIVGRADADNDGRITLVELTAYLQTFGLRIDDKGKIAFDESAKTAKDFYVPATPKSLLTRATDYVYDELPTVFWFGLYILINIFLFSYQFARYNGDLDLPAPPTNAVPWARGAGMLLNFNCALILVPMWRKTLSYLRSTRLNSVLPIDKSRELHIIMGWVILVATIIHGSAHFANYSELGVLHQSYDTDAGLTGLFLSAILIVIIVGALPCVRRTTYFHIFWITHHLFVLFFILLLMHGPGLISTNFWKFFLIPGGVYIIERAIRLKQTDAFNTCKVVHCEALPGNVVCMKVKRPRGSKVKPGQYIFLNVPFLSRFEYHPFTLTSTPEDNFFSVHIRAVGDWTNELLMRVDEARKCYVLVDGPYGAPSEDIFDFEVALMVGAGIGVTPFASILKNVKNRFAGKTGCVNPHCGCECSCCKFKIKKLYFVWTTRERASFNWFGDLLEDIHTGGLIEIQSYITGVKQKQNLGQTLARVGVESVKNDTGKDLVTGKSVGPSTRFQRPDWDEVFGSIQRAHKGKRIGVFFCGPDRLADILEANCRKYSSRTDHSTQFIFQKEIF